MYINTSSFVTVLALIPPEDLAKYIVTAIFTIINLLVTFFILKVFLFKPTIKFLQKRKEIVEDEISKARIAKKSADAKLAQATERIDKSIREATVIVSEARAQAESQSDSIISNAKAEAAEIVARADTDIERMRSVMLEEMRDEVADLSVAIASKVIRQTINEDKQREIIDRFIGEEIKGKGDKNGTN